MRKNAAVKPLKIMCPFLLDHNINGTSIKLRPDIHESVTDDRSAWAVTIRTAILLSPCPIPNLSAA